MPLAAIGLGANLASQVGEPASTLAAAFEALGRLGAVTPSSLYRTQPVGNRAQPDFVNAAALLETSLPPRALLAALLAIERRFGRERAAVPPKGPRTLDLDLLFHEDVVLHGPELTLPHPALHQRRFVLEPLAEIAPGWQHPLLRRTAAELLAELQPEPGAVVRLEPTPAPEGEQGTDAAAGRG